MPKNRKDLISQLINEGFTHRTLSSFSDNQIKVLRNKLLGEGAAEEISTKEKELADLKIAQSEKLANDAEQLTSEVDEEDNIVPPETKAMSSSGEELDLLNDILDDSIDEQKQLENWVMELVKENQQAEITKENFIKTVKEMRKPKIKVNKQQKSYKMVNELAKEMGLRVVVEEIKGNIKGYLKSKRDLIEVNITKEGDVTLNGEVVEDDMEANQPMPTIAPPTTKPGEKERRGPFKKPKTTPKPKAKKKSPLPDWLEFTNLGKSLSR
jgi:peroxiredoxin family protein